MSAERRLTAGLLGVLGFVAAVGPLSTDMYLASFTSIGADLGAAPSAVQLTLSLFMLGLGTGQLLLGPLSDRLGRKPVLMTALAVFVAAGAAIAITPSIEVFVALRFVQGFAGAGGVVLARAIAADLSTGATAVRALSLIATIVGLAPLLAPVVGAGVHELLGWRGVMATIAAVSAAMLLLAWLTIPESLPPASRSRGPLIRAFLPFGSLLRDRRFLALLVVFALAFGMMMSYIAASPFVGQRVLQMTPVVYALGFSAGASALILANLVNARVAPRVGPERMLRVGVAIAAAGSAALLALVLAGALAPWSFIACAFALTAGVGLTMSNTSALALAVAHKARGAGSALLGAAQFSAAASLAPLVGLWGEHTALPMAVSMSACALLAAALTATGPRRR